MQVVNLRCYLWQCGNTARQVLPLAGDCVQLRNFEQASSTARNADIAKTFNVVQRLDICSSAADMVARELMPASVI